MSWITPEKILEIFIVDNESWKMMILLHFLRNDVNFFVCLQDVEKKLGDGNFHPILKIICMEGLY